MKNLFILASFLPLLISCIRGGEALAKLDDVFSFIESRPDSIIAPKRLTLLNRFIAAHITPTFSKTAIEELEKLMQNKNDFIESTRLSFLTENPRFVEYLKQKGLKEAEIGYCCLYAMGLNGKEISSYLGDSHYKQSSSIRKKLGLTEHDTNLGLYLRGIIAKLQSKSLQQPHKKHQLCKN